MKNKLLLLSSIIISFAFSVAHAETDDEHLRWFGGPGVVYEFNQIGKNKYFLQATTANGVSVSELLAAYKNRASKLCRPYSPVLQYKVTSETYMGTLTATLRVPMQAPKITGTVTCE
jgi:hypothetical protein